MSDKENLDNQDFIETGDEFAQAMDENFDDTGLDQVLDGDDIAEPLESFDDSWSDDFEDYHDGEIDEDLAQMVQKPQRNWFNIGIFGVIGVVFLVMSFQYVLPYFSDGTSGTVENTGVALQNQSFSAPASSEQNTLFAQQALSQNETEQKDSPSNILDNPALLGDGVESYERPDPEAADNKFFEALGNTPEMPQEEVDDIFAAIDNLSSAEPQGTTPPAAAPQELPLPADTMSNDTLDVFEEIDVASVDQKQPRAPEVQVQQDTGLSALAEAILPAKTEEKMPEAPVAEVQVQQEVIPTTIDTAQMAALNARIDMVMTRLEKLAEKVDSLSGVEPVSAPVTHTPDVSRLEKTIQNLEKQIAELSKNKTASTPKKQVRKAKEPAPKTVSKKMSSAPKTPNAKKSDVKKKVIAWELRGASPGQAYVVEKGTQNLRTVKVGDTLKTIGRVTSIAVENGIWVVRGTSGRVTQ